ncbi:MAG: tetraacyldisaccharide 4'-kinase [Candidatus Marinimicrobia bacterium]|nr:tetraacyldisaccharide 4'-kinase [Candidatus Neomarinimicrobiota bacterium]
MKAVNSFFDLLIKIRHALYDNGFFKSQQVETPVISIGSITIGGAGKTPLTIAIAELLKNLGLKVAILSRGYKRNKSGIHQIQNSKNISEMAQLYGDEPTLIFKSINDVPVVVAKKRFDGAKFIEDNIRPDVILLDDGFQHRKLLHTADILIFKKDFEGCDEKYFPFGRLRDSLSRLKKSDLIFYQKGTNERVIKFLKKQSQTIEYSIEYKLTGTKNNKLKIEKPITAFCGIAKPKAFFHTLKHKQIICDNEITFQDHKKYTNSTMKKLLSTNANTFITTEKDLIKLSNSFVYKKNIVKLSMKIKFANVIEMKKILGELIYKTT